MLRPPTYRGVRLGTRDYITISLMRYAITSFHSPPAPAYAAKKEMGHLFIFAVISILGPFRFAFDDRGALTPLRYRPAPFTPRRRAGLPPPRSISAQTRRMQ